MGAEPPDDDREWCECEYGFPEIALTCGLAILHQLHASQRRRDWAGLTLSWGHYDVCSGLIDVFCPLGCNGLCVIRRALSVVLAMRLGGADEVIFHIVGDTCVN